MRKTFPEFDLDGFYLTEIHERDALALYTLFSNPRVMQFYDMPALSREEEGLELVNLFTTLYRDGIGVRWAIRLQKDGLLAGTCGVNQFNKIDRSAIVGYELLPEYWGQGIVSRALKKVCSLCFSGRLETPVNRIEASVLPENTSSIRVLEKNGFCFEGLLREKAYWGEQFHDMELYALLAREFKG